MLSVLCLCTGTQKPIPKTQQYITAQQRLVKKERQYNGCPLIVLVYQDSTISSLNIINISENVTMLISRAATGIAMFGRPSDLSDNFFATA